MMEVNKEFLENLDKNYDSPRIEEFEAICENMTSELINQESTDEAKDNLVNKYNDDLDKIKNTILETNGENIKEALAILENKFKAPVSVDADQEKFFNIVLNYKNKINNLNITSNIEFDQENKKIKLSEQIINFIEETANDSYKQVYNRNLSGNAKEDTNNGRTADSSVMIQCLSNYLSFIKEEAKKSQKEPINNTNGYNIDNENISKKVNANYAKEKASDKQNFTLTRGHIQLTRENSSFTTVQETDTRFISLLGEPASDKEVKLTEKFYDNWLNKPFGAENEIVSLSNKFTRSVLTSERPSKITSLKLTDTEVIVNDQRLNIDLNLSIGLQKSHLFNFNSHNFKSLKNLIQLYLSESYVEKAGKDLNLPFKNTFIELSDYLFKHFKYLNKLIIEKYTGERIGITRDMWGKGLENAVELLNDQEEINNNIKNSEYKNAADIGLKETFPKKYKGKQSANFITSNSYNRNGLYDKFTRKASYGKRYNGRKTNPVITTFRILISGPYLLGSMLFDKIGSLFKEKS